VPNILVLAFAFICSILALPATAQNQLVSDSLGFVVIDDIVLIGNRQTKSHIIKRELTLKEGDTLRLQKRDSVLARNQANIFNTNLFTIVEILLSKTQGELATLKVVVQERWYLFPIPLFELSDRNFNEWWTTYRRDLSRTNYGLRFRKDNFRGRRETLGFVTQFGFTQRFGIAYSNPYLTKNQRLGLNVSGGYGQNKAIAYTTENNKLLFVKNEQGNARERWDINFSLQYRPAFYAFHSFEASYQNLWVTDTIIKLNPHYYTKDYNKLRHASIGYAFRYDKRDAQAYALRGHVFKFSANYLGLLPNDNIKQFETTMAWGQYIPLSKKWFWDYQFIGQLSYNPMPSFARTLAMGYGDHVMRGYELYVITTQASGIAKQTLKYQFLNTIKKWKFIPIEQFQKVPLAMYATMYIDTGYALDRYFSINNTLNNKFLYSMGVGFDIVTYYNSVVRFNYAVNRLGQARLYLNFTTDL